MNDAFRIFVVDDDPLMLDLITDLLSEDYTVEGFPSAQACLLRLAAAKPDMFLLDITMPGMDGYALCRKLREDFETQDIPITFISANDTPEARLTAYEAGGEDFIVKPFSMEELLHKVQVAERITENKQSLRSQAGFAQQTAMTVMSSMSELGVVVQFCSKSFSCETPYALGQATLEALQQYGLEGAVQLRILDEELNLSANGTNVPLEVSVLNNVRASGRIFQFKSRCVFNYDNFTLMINNMPVDDPDRCGRIRDNGAILAESANARLVAITIDRQAKERQAALLDSVPRVHSALETLQDNYRQTCVLLTETMIEYQEELTRAFSRLGLTDSQEHYLAELANDYMQRMVAAQDKSLAVAGELEALSQALESVATRR